MEKVSAVFEVDNESLEGLESVTIESAIARFVGTLVVTLGAGNVSEELDVLCIVDNVKDCPKLLDTDIFETLIDSSPGVEKLCISMLEVAIYMVFSFETIAPAENNCEIMLIVGRLLDTHTEQGKKASATVYNLKIYAHKKQQ